MDLNDLLVEFTNKGRYFILKSLFEEKKRHSQLEKELNIPGPEISRNIKRLIKTKLITKTIDNKYEVTSIGKIFHELLDSFESIMNYENFFNAHDISYIPTHLIFQLGKLKFQKPILNQTMKNIQLWSDLVRNSDKFILAISDQFQDSILPIVEKKITNQSIEIKSLIEEMMLMESVSVGKKFNDRHAFYDKIDVFHNVRVLTNIGISLMVSDKGAILFMSKDGKIDYSQCLIGTSEPFIEWSKELFKYYWKKGENIRKYI